MARHLPPVYSPVGLGAIVSSVFSRRESSHTQLIGLLGDHFDAEHALLTGSGTQALQLAMSAALSEGTPVALPAYSCFDLVSAAVGARAPISFYDVDPQTLTPDLDSLERCVSEGARTIVAGNLYGYPLPWSELRKIAAHHDAILIEDAAQGLGSIGQGTPAGKAGHYTVLSFGRGKGWTGGGGGALLVGGGLDVPSLPPGTAVSRLRPAATSLAAWLLGRPSLYGIPASIPQLALGETVYHPPRAPGSISTFSAALARRTRAASVDAIPLRREQARRWAQEILDRDPNGDRILPCLPIGDFDSASSLRFAVRLQGADLTSDTWDRLRRHGVESGYPVPLPRLPEASGLFKGDPTAFPGAEALSASLVTLPTHSWVRDVDRTTVLDLLTGSAS